MTPIAKIQKGIQYWKRNGTRSFIQRLIHPRGRKPLTYEAWYRENRSPAAAASIAEDPAEGVTIRVLSDRESFSRAAREGVEEDFALFCPPDGVLEPDALTLFRERLALVPDADMIYADEGSLTPSGRHTAPCFKPDYSPEYLLCVNYIGYPLLVKASVLEAAGGVPERNDELSYWDMVLRCAGAAGRIEHIAEPLCHAPVSSGNRPSEVKTALGTRLVRGGALPDGAADLVTARIASAGMDGAAEFAKSRRCVRPVIRPKGEPKVSIIIPNKDQAETLTTCVSSILSKSTYRNYEIIIVENNSTQEKTFSCYDELAALDGRISVERYAGKFNFSKINNFGAERSDGEYLILLNNDTEVITCDWIERMLGICQSEGVGIVGAKLLYNDGTVQHAGVVIGIGGGASHVLSREDRSEDGYLCRLSALVDVSAVTAACMMIPSALYREMGGLDESFEVNFNDVDLCLRVREAGYRVVMNAGAELYHYESKSRGLDNSGEKFERFKDEVYRFRTRWKKLLDEGDPYYSKNLSLMYIDCRPRYAREYFEFIDQIEKERSSAPHV